jgi:glycine betaine/proline transport system ATP-binding protein
MSTIEVKNVSKIFGQRPERALKLLEKGVPKEEVQTQLGLVVGLYNISFEIKSGEVFVIMGLSGSGKSTLERLLNRLHEPTSGTILIDGKDITKMDHNELIAFRRKAFSGMVFQNFALLPHRTVIGNVEFGLELHGVDKETRQKRAREVIGIVGLKGYEDSYPNELSGGMQQRVGLARGLAVDADILLMDEAFSALDPLIRREMQDELLELQSKMKKTIIFVTHDLDEAFKLGDRIAILKDGLLVQLGTAEEIITNPKDDYVKAFVEGLDRTGVFNAGTIMQPVKATVHANDGPRTMLHKIRRAGLSSIFVVDSERTLKGYVKADAIADLVKKHGDTDKGKLDPSLYETPVTVDPETPLTEVINLASEVNGPIAVVDTKGKLLGVIVRGAIIAALSQNYKPENNGYTESAGTEATMHERKGEI